MDSFFGEWVVSKQRNGDEVFLVTGSDREKTIDQIGSRYTGL